LGETRRGCRRSIQVDAQHSIAPVKPAPDPPTLTWISPDRSGQFLPVRADKPLSP
jgi:hypothetical protein